MITKEMIMDVLKEMNLRPTLDEDGDINLRYRLRYLFVLFDVNNDGDGYVQIIMPRLYSLENQNEQMCALYVCNKVTRESKHVKAWVNESMDDIFCTSEFFANTKKELAVGLKNGLDLLSSISYVVKQEMVNYLTDDAEEITAVDDTVDINDIDDVDDACEIDDVDDTDVA